jgi:hypothetical protein
MPLLQTFGNASRRGFAPPSNGAGPAYELISTASGTGSSGTITFSSIPSYYKHLQIRYAVITASGGSSVNLRINGDTASNYYQHGFIGYNGAVGAYASSNTSMLIGGLNTGSSATYPFIGVVDIVDAFSTSKNKTVKSLSGIAATTGGNSELGLQSGLWNSTSAINSVSIIVGSTFNTTTRISIYGIRG